MKLRLRVVRSRLVGRVSRPDQGYVDEDGPGDPSYEKRNFKTPKFGSVWAVLLKKSRTSAAASILCLHLRIRLSTIGDRVVLVDIGIGDLANGSIWPAYRNLVDLRLFAESKMGDRSVL